MVDGVVCLDEQEAELLGPSDGSFCVTTREREGLLSEDVFPGLERSQGPGHVISTRRRDVDSLDLGIFERRFVGSITSTEAVELSEGASASRVPRGDSPHIDQIGAGQGDLGGHPSRPEERQSQRFSEHPDLGLS